MLDNKLAPKWSEPYRIKGVIGNGAYRLETLDAGPIPRTQNAASLKFYFSWWTLYTGRHFFFSSFFINFSRGFLMKSHLFINNIPMFLEKSFDTLIFMPWSIWWNGCLQHTSERHVTKVATELGILKLTTEWWVTKAANEWYVPTLATKWCVPKLDVEWCVLKATAEWCVPKSVTEWRVPKVVAEWRIAKIIIKIHVAHSATRRHDELKC